MKGIYLYLLVDFWFIRISANLSFVSIILTNRISDLFLTWGIFAILWLFNNINYSIIFSLASYVSENIVRIIKICFLINAVAENSQMSLHIWLPMAITLY